MFARAFARGLLVMMTMLAVAMPSLSWASVGTPGNLTIVGGPYTNDTTPTFTWSSASGATYYEYQLDSNGYVNIGNTRSYTLNTLNDGWHSFTLRARNSANEVSATSKLTFEIDTVGPTVTAVGTASVAYEDESTRFTVSPYGESSTVACDLYVNGSNKGSMSKSGSTFSKYYTFNDDGAYTVYARCTDDDDNVTTGSSRTISVVDRDDDDSDNNNDDLYVPTVTPSTATEDEEVTLRVSPSGDNDIEDCDLYVNGSYKGNMWASGSSFIIDYTFTNDGSYSVYARCTDDEGNVESGSSRTVTVYEADDNDSLVVPAVSPSTATEDEEVTIRVSPYGDEVESCDLYVDGANRGEMDEDDGDFEFDYTFSNDGTYAVYARCTTEDGYTLSGVSRTVTVYEQDDEEGDLYVPAVTPSTATEDEEVTLRVTPSGDYDVDFCTLYVNGANAGNMYQSGSSFEKDYTFSVDGSYTVYARCTDERDDTVSGTSRTITVYDEDDNHSNDGDFYVPAVTPSTATEDEAVTIRVTPEEGDYEVDSCSLYVNGSNVGSMSRSGSSFQKSYTFNNDGAYTVYARCTDEDDNTVSGTSRTITVYDEDEDIDFDSDFETGDLIKTVCRTSDVNDPCRAVYYYGEDGERHPFPNEDVYFSWYNDFDDVIEISDSDMSDIQMGDTVTLKPGTAVIKFATSNEIYAVSEGGVLHRYLSSSIISADYGSDWASADQVIMSDVFFSDYVIGDVISSSLDYDPEAAEESVTSIDDNF